MNSKCEFDKLIKVLKEKVGYVDEVSNIHYRRIKSISLEYLENDHYFVVLHTDDNSSITAGFENTEFIKALTQFIEEEKYVGKTVDEFRKCTSKRYY